MKTLRYGVVGLGNMGKPHAKDIVAAKSKVFSLTAVCDINPDKAELAKELGVPFFEDAEAMIDSGLIDAIIIATPHYWHAPIAVYAARKGVHVLCEKPLSSSVGPARAMIAECKKNKVALGVVLHHRTRKIMQKMHKLATDGSLGNVFHVQMVCSNWFRSQNYYDSGAWRGTWDGEGGGVLINQAPHSLDLFQWIGGMPKRMTAVIDTRAHDIEVEDTANIICEYGDGKVGYIYATTAEYPGKEEIILSADKGTLVWDGKMLKLGKIKMPLPQFIAKAASFGHKQQSVEWKDIPVEETGFKHVIVISAFADHIVKGKPFPYATGELAINELELSNAAYLSGYTGKPVELPVDADAMEKLLDKLVRERSTGRGGDMRAKANKRLKQLLAADKTTKKAKSKK